MTISRPLLSFLLFSLSSFLLLAYGVNGAAAPQVKVPDSSDAIVSEKDEVELVEDSSVREAIDRRPDLSFSNVTIDGEGSRRSLDSISADSVESVEVMKAVTPDQDADSRGGSISLKTRPSYSQSQISTKIGIESEYESLVGEPGFGGTVSVGGPLNKERSLGGRFTIGYEQEKDGTQYTSKDWFRRTVNGERESVLKEIRLFNTRENNEDLDLSASLDYKVNDGLRLYLRGSHKGINSRSESPHYEYRLNRGEYVSVDDNGANVIGTEVERGLYLFEYDFEIIETSLGGEWSRGDFEGDFKYVYQEEEYTPLDYLNIDFVMDDVDIRYDYEDPQFPVTTITNGKSLQDAASFEFEDFLSRTRLNNENDAIIATNVKWKNAFGNEHLTMRFGAKQRARENERNYQVDYFDGYLGEGDFNLASVVSDAPDDSILEGRYTLDTHVDEGLTEAFISDNSDSFRYDERRSRENSDSTSYYAEKMVDGYFGMLDFNQGKWRTLLGMRFEDTSLNFQSNEVLLGKDELDRDNDGDVDEIVYLSTNPTTGSRDYSHSFSNAHVRYKMNDCTTFIASFTNTIKRPEYSDVVPFRRVRLEEREIEEGNPDLNPTLYTNLDMSVDYRLGEEGLVSLELFDRKIDDFIFSAESFISGGIYDGFELERQENSASAKARGVSMSWKQPLNLPLVDNALSFNANYLMQDSELEYPARPGEILPLARRPDTEFKLALNYEQDKIFAQLKFEAEDGFVYRVASSAEDDRYFSPSAQLDLAVSYKLKDKTRFYVEWDNVTNEPALDLYEGVPERATYYRLAPWSLTTGLKFEL